MADDVDMDNDPVPWYKVPKKRRISETEIPLVNRFTPLAQQPDTITSPTSAATSAATSADNNQHSSDNEVRPPAFFISDNIDSVEAMITTFIKLTGKDAFTYRCVKDNVRINAANVASYKTLTKYCKVKSIPYYTHQLKSERAFKVIVKGLHHSYPVQSLTEEIQSIGHTVRRINKLWNKRNNEPFNLFMIELEPAANNKDIYNLKAIDHCIVSVEAPHQRREDVQCHRCQDWGHSKNYCERPPKCVKCGEDHLSSECTQNRDIPPKCVHCKQQHTANYKGCPMFKRRQATSASRAPPPVPNRPEFRMEPAHFPSLQPRQAVSNNNYVDPGLGYAHMAMDQRMARLEKLVEKQIELCNSLMVTMSKILSSLCPK